MGGEGEFKTHGYCGIEDTVYVAVSKDFEEGKALLLWAVKNFTGKSICLLHIHQPNQSTQLWNRMISFGKLKWQAVATYKEPEHRKMNEDLDQYFLVLEQTGVRSGGVWSVRDNIEKGIVQIIAQHGVRLLVMGAVEKHYSKKSSMFKSTKALYVLQNAPASCQVVLSCKDCLITPRSISLSSELVSIDMIPSDTNHGSTLVHARKEHSHNLKRFQSLKLKESWVHDGGDKLSSGERMVDDLTLCSMSKSQDWTSCPMGHKVQLARSTHHETERIMLEAENSKKRAFEESVSRWRAEEDAMEAKQLAKASESLCLEERNKNKEMEELLSSQRRDLEILKDQHEQFLNEDQMIQDQKPSLERRITENRYLEDELEKKIIQAVTLLISFKDKRDMLQIERDNTIETAAQLRKSAEEVTPLSFSRFFAFSFSDILEATKHFDPTLKIGEGRLGTVYMGKNYHVDVAIRMLPFCGSLSDLEFKQKAEILSRVRHPNIVTMYGVCTESRSLIYEYLENGSLEDYLTGPFKINNPLPWQIRIRVVVEICSVLIFLHKNKTSIVLGNLRPDKILLDANFVSKLSDMGIHVLVPQDDNSKASHIGTKESEDSSYLDPEITENGESTSESDIFSFGIFILHLLTTRPASTVAKDIRRMMDDGNLNTILDHSAGKWPLQQTKDLAVLALRCCEEKRKDRPDLEAEVWPIIESMRDICSCSSSHSTSSLKSQGQQRIPSHFVCPILQEVMTDPYIAADGFTYEADAIKSWLESGHKTSPMTNLELEHCDLLPNYALYYAIHEWQEQS